MTTNHDNVDTTKREKPQEVENNTSVLSEPQERTKKKRNNYTWSNEGCTNQVVSGGVCRRHGVSWTKPTCIYEGCTNYARNGIVCIRHGAYGKRYICSHEECTNYVVKGGVCWTHGAKKDAPKM